MKKLMTVTLLLCGATVSTMAAANHDAGVYSSRAECRAALKEARQDDPLLNSRDCRQVDGGWSFRAKNNQDGQIGPGDDTF
jgi:hypothetical protein